jgi:hypothetical protein
MKTVSERELVEQYQPEPKVGEAWRRACDDLRHVYPIRSQICEGVKYDSKTDRYVATFSINQRSHSMKVTTEVAMYLLEALSQKAMPCDYWLRMNPDGAIFDCCLVTL